MVAGREFLSEGVRGKAVTGPGFPLFTRKWENSCMKPSKKPGRTCRIMRKEIDG